MSIYLFCEGQTEINVVKKFATLADPNVRGKGKDQVNKEMHKRLGPRLNQLKAVRALIMRDVDQEETPQSIVQSVTDAVRSMLIERGFQQEVQFEPCANHPNVYLLTLSKPDPFLDLRLALHLATDKWKEDFINATIDDYVLNLALREETVISFLQKKKWSAIKPEQIIAKVTDHIPALLQKNGIRLSEAKDYVRLYATVIQMHTSPPVFAEKTLANAAEADKQTVFASLLAALDYLGEGSS